ncbi:UNVERIFIED_CONTAM: hypothetical protein GTU68_007406 [Idotea baltica]|nr:hypothetical protein [Idotea baltica]
MTAEAELKDNTVRAREQALKIKEEAEKAKSFAEKEANKAQKEINKRENQLQAEQSKIKNLENTFNQKSNSLKTKEKEVEKLKEKFTSRSKELDGLKGSLEAERKEVNDLKARIRTKLEKIAGLSAEEAKEKLKEAMVKKAETEALAMTKDIIDEAKMQANKEAKKLVIQTIQRVAAEHTIENAVSVFNLDSDELKGQIIGREGRNIRALEAATGVEIIVDDTPEAVIISGYDPYRREICRLSMQRLVADGRIHPARIEEVVAKTRKQLEQQIVEIGERTVIDMNIHGLHPQLVRLVGKMKFRSSYGQNLLQHSRETANLCAIMAAELNISTKVAKRAGLLHDIGKVSDEDPDLSHALLGMKLAEKYKEKPEVCNAIGAHHDEIEMKYMISPIVQACDAISGSRPGARREILEQYLKRIKDLEELASSKEGVDKAYAIQAGRELRVIVSSDNVTDDTSEKLSFEIATEIQNTMQYPGQIKVTVIREKRAVNFAK